MHQKYIKLIFYFLCMLCFIFKLRLNFPRESERERESARKNTAKDWGIFRGYVTFIYMARRILEFWFFRKTFYFSFWFNIPNQNLSSGNCERFSHGAFDHRKAEFSFPERKSTDNILRSSSLEIICQMLIQSCSMSCSI